MRIENCYSYSYVVVKWVKPPRTDARVAQGTAYNSSFFSFFRKTTLQEDKEEPGGEDGGHRGNLSV